MSDNPMAKHKRVRRSKEEDPTMETRILESCVRKILSLLAIGFGEAGSEVQPQPPPMLATMTGSSCSAQQLGACALAHEPIARLAGVVW